MYSFFLGGLFSLIASLFLDSPAPVHSWKPFLFGLFYITVIHNVICYNIFACALNRFSVAFMTFAGFTNPLFTATYGYLFLNEKVGIPFFFSLFLVFLGIYIYSRQEAKQLKS